MDLGDIKRFDSLEGKYPNFKTIVIKTQKKEKIELVVQIQELL
jgi:hypothetical protein